MTSKKPTKPKNAHIAKVVKEIDRRRGSEGIISRLESSCFDKQLAFINDPSRFKSLLCSRRSGKSMAAGIYLAITALKYPRSTCLYLALTKQSAKTTMVKDIFEELQIKYNIDYIHNRNEQSITFANGSIIYLIGLDANEKEAAKLRGQKPKLVIIDECQSFNQNLEDIINQTLRASLSDLRGTVCMLGTCGNRIDSYFFKATTGLLPEWSNHSWTAFDNPHQAVQWKEDIDAQIAANPLVVETPNFRQEYLNEWIIDRDRIVYKFNEDRNVVSGIPDNKYHYLLGVDTGYVDESAFVVVAYAENDPNLYVVETYKKAKMIAFDLATKIKHYINEYSPDRIVIDGQNKIVVEEIRQRYGIPLTVADKIGKVDFIELLNSDLIKGTIKLHHKHAAPLIKEWLNLVWSDKTGRRVEHPGCPNHCSDSFLYVWKYAYNYTYREGQSKAQISFEEYEKQLIAKEIADLHRDDNLEWWEL